MASSRRTAARSNSELDSEIAETRSPLSSPCRPTVTADVMEAVGMKRVVGLSLRRVVAKAITVERAANIHRVPVDELLDTLNTAIDQTESEELTSGT